MTLLELATWAAVGVLVVGSLAVFGWFLRDAVRLFGALGAEAEVQERTGEE